MCVWYPFAYHFLSYNKNGKQRGHGSSPANSNDDTGDGTLTLSLVNWLIHPANFYNYLCIPNGSYLVHHSLHWYKIDDIPTSIDYKLLSSNPSPSHFPLSSHKLYYTLSDCSCILPITFQSTVSSACPTNLFSSKEDKIEET